MCSLPDSFTGLDTVQCAECMSIENNLNRRVLLCVMLPWFSLLISPCAQAHKQQGDVGTLPEWTFRTIHVATGSMEDLFMGTELVKSCNIGD